MPSRPQNHTPSADRRPALPAHTHLLHTALQQRIHNVELHLCAPSLRRRVLLDDIAHLPLVRRAVFLELVERVGLCGRVWVRLVEQRLDAEENLLDGYGGLPAFFFVEDAEADGAGGVDVGVEEWGDEFACCRSSVSCGS